MAEQAGLALLPEEILKKLEPRLNSAAVHDDKAFVLALKLAAYCLPPNIGRAFREAIRILADSNPVGCPLDPAEISYLGNAWGVAPGSRAGGTTGIGRVALTHPLYFGLVKLQARLRRHPPAEKAAILGLYLDLLAIRMDSATKEFSRTIYYTDVLAPRDALAGELAATRFSVKEACTLEQVRAGFARWVADTQARLADQANVAEHIVRKLRTLELLLSGERRVGVPLVERAPVRRTIVRSESVPGINPEKRTVLGARWRVDYVAQAGATGSGDGASAVLVRDTGAAGSVATAKDDLGALRHVLAGIEASNTPACSDMHRMPMAPLRQLLRVAYCAYPLAFAYIWMLVATGFAPRALESLDTKPPKDDPGPGKMRLCLETGVLTFVPRVAATHAAGRNPTAPLAGSPVRLVLPAGIVSILETKGEGKEPFSGISAGIDYVVEIFKRENHGILPTPERIAASFWLHVAPHMGGGTLAANLTGRGPAAYAAQVRYYPLSLDALNRTWYAALRKFGAAVTAWPSCGDEVAAFFERLSPKGPFPEGNAGSQVARDLPDYARLIEATGKAFDLLGRETLPRDGAGAVAAMARRINLQAVNLAAMHALVQALRPHHNEAALAFSDPAFGTWTHDKDSSRFMERRVTALPAIVIEQSAEHRKSIDLFIEVAKRLGVGVDVDRKALKRNIPMHIGSGRLNGCEVHVLRSQSHKDIECTLGEHAIAFPGPGNSFRHLVAKLFKGTIGQPLLDAWLGHLRGGFDIHAPYSSASVVYIPALSRALEPVLEVMSFRVLKVEGI